MDHAQELSTKNLVGVIEASAEMLQRFKGSINRLNVYPVPDGDTGSNLALTFQSVLDEVRANKDNLSDIDLCVKAISKGALMGARGNSGVIFSQIIRGFAEGVKRSAITGDDFFQGVIWGLGIGSDLADKAVLKPVEGTILTVARKAAAVAGSLPETDQVTSIYQIRDGSVEALLDTPRLLPILAAANVVDAGGAGFVLFIDAIAKIVDPDYREWERTWLNQGSPGPSEFVNAIDDQGSPFGDVSELKYEVMFLLESTDAAVDGFREVWAGTGDSIVIVGQDGIWNCHIHTDDIGASIEAGIEAGRLRNIRVTDLSEQVSEERWVVAAQGSGAPDPLGVSDEGSITSVVAVANGEGIGRIFRSMGVNRIVMGGQSMNPSTADIVAAIDELESDKVIVLPNNPNIIPVAQLASELSSREVVVLPTSGVIEGFAALMEFDPAASIAENVDSMSASVKRVVAGEVTRAVRSSTWSGGKISKGSYLGIGRGGILSVEPRLVDVSKKLLEMLISPGAEIVTVIEGEGSSQAVTREIYEWVASKWSQIEVEIHHGGQPLYPYLFGVE
ncbi:MAG: DAK2 domain-containing protein [Acidimicrobiaceae bacterium]|nr:DAK2 domain-containing protein [Acidimicrobiaceae bacterium]